MPGFARVVHTPVHTRGSTVTTRATTCRSRCTSPSPEARKADRLEAAKWLADRGFGRAIQGLEIDVAQRHYLDVTQVSTEDLEALIVIAERYQVDADEMVVSGRFAIGSSSLAALGSGTERSARS